MINILKKLIKAFLLFIVVIIPFSLILVGLFIKGKKLYKKYYKEDEEEVKEVASSTEDS